MEGKVMIIMGIICEVMAVIVLLTSIIYQKTAGKKVMEELETEYQY